jgi:ABC-type antimicrobial peptide transport system permease subunit
MAMAMMLGVAGAIVAQAYASAGHAQLLAQLRRLGLSVVTVTPKQSRNSGVRARTGAPVTTLGARDYAEIRRRVSGINRASAIVGGAFLAKAGDLSKNNCSVLGVEPEFALIRNWHLNAGASFSEDDERAAARVAVLGAKVARDLFNDTNPIGLRVFINRVPFRVMGVLAESGTDLEAGGQDEEIFVPLRTASRRLLNVENYSSLALNVSDGTPMASVTEALRSVLTSTHRAKSSLGEDFKIQTQQALADAAVDAAGRVKGYVGLVTAGALLSAGFGLLAVCWIGVGQRTPELGTRRALGASAGDILSQLLFEVGLTGMAAAVVGVLLGWTVCAALSRALRSPLDFQWPVAWWVAGSATLLALVFGTAPAIRAARINPILALQTK